MNAIAIVANGMREAFGRMVIEKNIEQNLDKMIEILKKTFMENLETTREEWKAAIEMKASESQIKTIMNIQANDLAVKALRAYTA